MSYPHDTCWLAQDIRGKKGEARARQVVETSLILLEGRATASEKELDSLLELLREVGDVWSTGLLKNISLVAPLTNT